MSREATEALEIARQYDKTLRADDPRFRRAVHIVTDEGTSLFYYHSFLMRIGEWIVIFSEHHPTQVYHVDELLNYNQFELVWEIEQLKGG